MAGAMISSTSLQDFFLKHHRFWWFKVFRAAKNTPLILYSLLLMRLATLPVTFNYISTRAVTTLDHFYHGIPYYGGFPALWMAGGIAT